MAWDKTDKTDKTPTATPAANWEELSLPKSYQEAVALASLLIEARLKDDPKARWRIRIERTEAEPPRIYLKTDQQGRTRAEFFAKLASGDANLSMADRAMASRLKREEAGVKAKGRPNRDQAALKNPAGQSVDTIVFETCLILACLGWKPLARADEAPKTSIFDVVADALNSNQPRHVSYSGMRDAYYRAKSSAGTRH